MFFWPVGVGLSVVECCDWERRINRAVAFYRRSQALPLRRARPHTDSEPPPSGVLLCCPENNVGPEGSGLSGLQGDLKAQLLAENPTRLRLTSEHPGAIGNDSFWQVVRQLIMTAAATTADAVRKSEAKSVPARWGLSLLGPNLGWCTC